jgi:6-pyruvoyltetrahydropterin/6-carboxytetrahydropterin synthase
MITCTRRLTFEAGHRLLNHRGKCSSGHGHSYKAEITVEADLDDQGMVIDFGAIKEYIGHWLDNNWDHTMILYDKDNHFIEAMRKLNLPVYVMPCNPTAENMAQYLLRISESILDGTRFTVQKIKLWETENCYAEAFKV